MAYLNPAIIHIGQMADVCEIKANSSIWSKDRITKSVAGFMKQGLGTV